MLGFVGEIGGGGIGLAQIGAGGIGGPCSGIGIGGGEIGGGIDDLCIGTAMY